MKHLIWISFGLGILLSPLLIVYWYERFRIPWPWDLTIFMAGLIGCLLLELGAVLLWIRRLEREWYKRVSWHYDE